MVQLPNVRNDKALDDWGFVVDKMVGDGGRTYGATMKSRELSGLGCACSPICGKPGHGLAATIGVGGTVKHVNGRV